MQIIVKKFFCWSIASPILQIEQAITEFYKRAFSDMIIGHFFHGRSREELTAKQIDFATNMLGGPKRYTGKPLREAHRPFILRTPHFNRRQVIMKDVLEELQLDPQLASQWLQLEEQLRPLIVNASHTCLHG